MNAGRAEVRAMIERATERRRATGQPTIFFLDEIHRFNKAQQDALLPAVEEGLVTLIGATTENPYFEVNSALLSRAQIYELRAAHRRSTFASCSSGRSPTPSAGSPIRHRSPTRRSTTSPSASGGDARTAYGALERAVEAARGRVVGARPRGSPRTRCSARR